MNVHRRVAMAGYTVGAMLLLVAVALFVMAESAGQDAAVQEFLDTMSGGFGEPASAQAEAARLTVSAWVTLGLGLVGMVVGWVASASRGTAGPDGS